MVKLNCSFSGKTGSGDGGTMDSVPLISPLDVSQLQPSFADQVRAPSQPALETEDGGPGSFRYGLLQDSAPRRGRARLSPPCDPVSSPSIQNHPFLRGPLSMVWPGPGLPQPQQTSSISLASAGSHQSPATGTHTASPLTSGPLPLSPPSSGPPASSLPTGGH